MGSGKTKELPNLHKRTVRTLKGILALHCAVGDFADKLDLPIQDCDVEET